MIKFKGTTTSVDSKWFESKTREEQIDYVSNLQEFKYLPKKQKDQKVKEVLNGVNAATKKQDSASQPSEPKKSNRRSNSKQSRGKKSED